MRGSAAFRTGVAPGGALAPAWVRDALWRNAGAVPSLDLRFAENKSLVDSTTGQNLVTFTRASSGTYVDSQGVIRTATTNLLSFSENLASGWGILRASISSDSAIAPSGASTADKLIEDTTATATHYVYRYPTLVANTLYTYSVYLKADGRNFAVIGLNNSIENTGARVAVNLSTGTLGAPYALGTGSSISASISNAGSGWWRVSLSAIIDSSSTAGLCTIYLSNSIITSGVPSYTGDGTSGVLVWGAQLEQSSTLGEYISTTSTINSAPRFDHNPTTGESLGLLVEESRTNLLVRSEELGNASWTGSELNTSITSNSTLAPDGTLTADTIDFANASAYRYQTVSGLTAGNAYTFSIWLASGTKTQTVIRLAGTATGTGGQAVVSLTSGLTRYSVTVTLPAGNTAAFVGFENRVAVGGGNGGTGTIIAWGAQLEAGSFPTSYIPTTTAAATRSADVASITGTNFSSWYRQDEGTVFADAKEYPFTSGASRAFYNLDASSATNTDYIRQWIWSGASGSLLNSVYTSASGPVAAEFTQLLTNEQKRVATAVKVNDFARSYNGNAAVVDAAGNLPVGIDRLGIGSTNNSLFMSGTIRRLTYWPARLANSTLQAITQ